MRITKDGTKASICFCDSCEEYFCDFCERAEEPCPECRKLVCSDCSRNFENTNGICRQCNKEVVDDSGWRHSEMERRGQYAPSRATTAKQDGSMPPYGHSRVLKENRKQFAWKKEKEA